MSHKTLLLYAKIKQVKPPRRVSAGGVADAYIGGIDVTDSTCSVDDCERTDIKAHGWCGLHYQRWWRTQNPDYHRNRYNPERARAYARRYRRLNSASVRDYNRQWREANPDYGEAWREENAERLNEARRQWRIANPEAVNEGSRRWRARKASAITVPFTPEELEARLSMFGFRCWMCGGEYKELDHVKPISVGGPHCLSNLRPACSPCNKSKNANWPWPTQISKTSPHGEEADPTT